MQTASNIMTAKKYDTSKALVFEDDVSRCRFLCRRFAEARGVAMFCATSLTPLLDS